MIYYTLSFFIACYVQHSYIYSQL